MRRVAWLLGIVLAGCAAPPSVFPQLEQPLSDARVLELLAARTALPGYAGVVSMDYEDPEVQGSLEAVVNWRPEHLRVTAFKGLVVTDYDVFDLLLVPAGYALRYLDDAREDALVRGTLAEFTESRPRQAGFYWVGEALLLPGRTVGEAEVRRPDDERLEVAGTLSSGARVVFELEPATLEVHRARIEVPGERRAIELRYADYVREGEAFLPRATTLEDPSFQVRVEFALDEGEPTAEFADYVFDLDDVGRE